MGIVMLEFVPSNIQLALSDDGLRSNAIITTAELMAKIPRLLMIKSRTWKISDSNGESVMRKDLSLKGEKR